MKRYHLYLFLIGTLVVSCNSNRSTLLQVTNPHDDAREDASVLISREKISKLMDLHEDKIPQLMDSDGNPLPCQADDVDMDGRWDELFALIDLPAGGDQKVELRFVSPGEYPSFEPRTNLRLGDATRAGYPELYEADRLEGISYHNHSRTGEVYQMEGPAWENDRVGFRNYFDQRNGMDIFGKLTREMVLDSVGIAGKPSYHEPADWGMDLLKVGTSLGAGAIGYLHNDSIYRVGDNGSGTYQVVFEGPLRSRFNLRYSDWNVDGTPIQVLHQVEITAGRHHYQGTVTYSGEPDDLKLVPGIVNMKSDTLYTMDLGQNHMAFVTHDAQAEDGSLMALALMVPKDYLVDQGEVGIGGSGITQTYYVVLDAGPGEPVPYRFYALWEKEDPRWSSLEDVTGYLAGEAARWTQSVITRALY
ncbi:MAG: DUF4861 family protein [Bacteroidota bacterium]